MDTLHRPPSEVGESETSELAFQRFLHWIDGTRHSHGYGYLEIRDRLVNYFDRKNCLYPDELADEVLDRVARRLDEEGALESELPAKYCYIVARYVFLEYLRSPLAKTGQLDEDLPHEQSDAGTKERTMGCLDRCIEKLDLQNREMILEYYVGLQREKIVNRRRLAEKIGVSMNALSIRACRIRSKLERCVRQCTETMK